MDRIQYLLARATATINARRVAKGNKPLGAAFSHGRAKAKELDQSSHEDVLRHANAYLRSKGHKPVANRKDAKVSKGLLSRFRALTLPERADYGVLLEQGFEPHEARALAQAGTSGAVRKADRAGYHEAYVAEAAKRLPLDVHNSLHKIARARAGGNARATSLGDGQAGIDAAEDGAAQLWRKRLASDADKVPGSDESIAKDGPSLGEVSNFGAPAGSKLKFKVKLASDGSATPPKGVQAACARGLELAPKYGGPGLTEGAKSRARSMSKGNSVSLSTIKRIAAYHARHTEDKTASPPSPGYVAFMLWGGAAGKAWASAALRSAEKNASDTVQKRRQASDELSDAFLRRLSHVRNEDSCSVMADRLLGRISKSVPSQQSVDNSAAVESEHYQRLFFAQELATRMDDAMAAGAISVDEARQRASDQLARQSSTDGKPAPGSFDAGNEGGLRLDLNAGPNRQPGFLSLDTYPHDFATVLHDVELGLPVPSGSAAAIRAVGTMQGRPALQANPLTLLKEIQRALTIGGQLIYEGPNLSDKTLAQLPGLRLKGRHQSSENVERFTARRIEAQLPVAYGADPALFGRREERPSDIDAAAANFGLTPPPASVTMANLLNKTAERVDTSFGAKVLKKDTWEQIVYGVVLAPDEEDSQGDVISAEEIQKTAHRFLESRMVGNEHLGPLDSASVVESYIAPQDLSFVGAPAGAQAVPKGAWVLGVHIADDELWEKVLQDEFTGFSVGGFGDRTPLA